LETASIGTFLLRLHLALDLAPHLKTLEDSIGLAEANTPDMAKIHPDALMELVTIAGPLFQEAQEEVFRGKISLGRRG